MKIRIAYFSWKGHTEKIANDLAKMLDAELVRIEPAVGAPEGFGIAVDGMKAAFGLSSGIKPAKTDLAGIDTLVIATPVWSHKVPPYVNAYLAAVSGGEEKPFHMITEMGGSGAESALAAVKKRLEKKGMRFVSYAATVERDVESGAYLATVEAFAEGIGKQ